MRQSGFFIRAREEKSWTETQAERQTGREKERERPAALSGEEVRDFYQSLFEDEEERRRVRQQVRVRQRHVKGGGVCDKAGKSGGAAVAGNPPPAGRAQGYRLLRCAEQGDMRGVEELLRGGCDLNFRDQFNWSALMSAAAAGRTHIVTLLLHMGALWAQITDAQGRNARDLARLAGHHDVVRLLEQFSVTQNSHTSHTPAEFSITRNSHTSHTPAEFSVTRNSHTSHTPADPTHSAPPPQWCEVCAVCYTDSAHTHTSSLLHQFSLKRPPSVPHYCLTPSSVGYKLMLHLGWDPHSGLGPQHSGRRHPVSTVLKSDTAGLGFGPIPRSKVTHFKANDVQAVRRATKRREKRQERGTTDSAKNRKRTEERQERGTTDSTKNRKRTEERQRQWERHYRASFNIDL